MTAERAFASRRVAEERGLSELSKGIPCRQKDEEREELRL